MRSLRASALGCLVVACTTGVVSAASVRVTSSSGPDGTHATVNGNPVQPGDWSDANGRGSYQKGPHSSRVEYSTHSSTSGSFSSGSAWSGSTTVSSDGEEECEYEAVRMTQQDGQEPVVTRTKGSGCNHAGAADGEPKHKIQDFEILRERLARRGQPLLVDASDDGDDSENVRGRGASGSAGAGESRWERRESGGGWGERRESDGGGIDADFGEGMRARARGHAGPGGTVRETVSASETRRPDGSTARRASASATATSRSSAPE